MLICTNTLPLQQQNSIVIPRDKKQNYWKSCSIRNNHHLCDNPTPTCFMHIRVTMLGVGADELYFHPDSGEAENDNVKDDVKVHAAHVDEPRVETNEL